MKRDALVTALQAAWDCEDAITHYAAYRELAKLQGRPTDELVLKTQELRREMSAAINACIRADILVRLFCETEATDAFATLKVKLRQTASQIQNDDFIELKRDTSRHLQSLIDLALATAREELRVQSKKPPPPVP